MPFTWLGRGSQRSGFGRRGGGSDFTWIPGIRSPRLKYSVLELERAADVPIPYKLLQVIKGHKSIEALPRICCRFVSV